MKEVEIEHVIVANNVEKVEEFIIEHTMTDEPAAEEGQEGEENAEDKDAKDEK